MTSVVFVLVEIVMAILSLFSKPNTQRPSSSFPVTRSVSAKADDLRLATFIRKNEKQIIEHWEIFARTLVPASDDMSPRNLRNHIKDMLAFIADDIGSSQTDSEQEKKSEGKKPKNTEHSAAEIHASLRQAGGFSMDQMVSEFRALRASVIRLWEAQLTEATKTDISDLTRFNESIDQAITEAISYYTKTIDHSRDLSDLALQQVRRSALQGVSGLNFPLHRC